MQHLVVYRRYSLRRLLLLAVCCASWQICMAQEVPTEKKEKETTLPDSVGTEKKELIRAEEVLLGALRLRTLPDSFPAHEHVWLSKRMKAPRPERVPLTVIKKRLGDPSRAALLSAALPGAGQIYNKKAWKAPLVWGLLGTLGYTVNLFHNEYIDARDNLFFLTDGNSDTQVSVRFLFFSEENLRRRRDKMRRDRDYYIIMSALAYGLVLADASVDAHLNRFDVSDNLALSISPSVQAVPSLLPLSSLRFAPGLSVALTLR